jgi:hypothetical protein
MGHDTIDNQVFNWEKSRGNWMNEDGEETWGAKNTLQVGEWNGRTGNRKYGIKGPGFSGGANHSESETEIGASANLVAADWTWQRSNKERNDDRSLHVGGSVGVGAGGRLHHSDKDNDGRREWGVGVDAGPVSFDFSTESETLDDVASWAGMGNVPLLGKPLLDKVANPMDHYAD